MKKQSNSHRHHNPSSRKLSKKTSKKPVFYKSAILVLLLCLLIAAPVFAYVHSKTPAPKKVTVTKTVAVVKPKATTKPATTVAPTSTTPTVKTTEVGACASNTGAQLLIISISSQHLWACNGTTQSYDSAVVTGMELYPADLTPTGTYHIYAKETDQTLAGHDSTGSWSDPVSYWMPFLDNQYGEYGFHDATWRATSDFGNININNPYTDAEHGSHGCVELPLAAAAWIYNWSVVGTPVTIES